MCEPNEDIINRAVFAPFQGNAGVPSDLAQFKEQAGIAPKTFEPDSSILAKTAPKPPGSMEIERARFEQILRRRMSGGRRASFLGSDPREGMLTRTTLGAGVLPTSMTQRRPAASFLGGAP